MSLYESFQQVTDPRAPSGLRIPLPALLCMVVMAHLSGHSGYRATATFMKGNREELMAIFGLRHPPLGHTQLRTVFQLLDFGPIGRAFSAWAGQLAPLGEGEWVSGDGKSLASTVCHAHSSSQDFEQMVRLFGQRLGTVLQVATTRSKASELKAMQELLGGLADKGVIITLDALHCQKKP